MLLNMPSTYSSTTKASSEVSAYSTADTILINKNLFVAGTNVIAVEIHQFSASGPDIYFDLQLKANPVVNQPPTANAGTDQSITLPTSSVTLSGSGSDADGSISSYAWTQLSGPVTGSIATPSSASTGVSGLSTAGTYIYRLSVTDNNGATAADTVSVTVNPAPSSTLTLVSWNAVRKPLAQFLASFTYVRQHIIQLN